MNWDYVTRPPLLRDLQHCSLTHRFVPVIPDRLEPGVIYVAPEYGTAVHICCCGCGQEVVTPLTPTDWHITFDGETVSLWPSVGNWNAACRSHYIIDRGQVIPCGDWSEERIAAARRRDRSAKAQYYESRAQASARKPNDALTVPHQQPPEMQAGRTPRVWWGTILRWLSSRRLE